jgi:hypothetical protein
MWDIFLPVVVIGSRDFSAMHAACRFQNIVAILGPLASRFVTISIGKLLDYRLISLLLAHFRSD